MMENEIEKKYGTILNNLKKMEKYLDMNDYKKIKSRFESVYNDVINHLQNGNIKKKEVDCFNWFEIYVSIVNHEKECYLSRFLLEKEDKMERRREGNYTKNSKDYIIAQNNKRIYKIISKPIDVVNNSIDEDYYSNFYIGEYIQIFKEDALLNGHFPYKPDLSELIMVFIDTPSSEVYNYGKEYGIKIIGMNELQTLSPILQPKIINIDVNVIVSLCSEMTEYSPSSDMIQNIIKKNLFIGYDVNMIGNMTGEELCEYMKNDRKERIEEINSYDRIIICENVLCEASRIINSYGTDHEKENLKNLKNIIDYQVVPNGEYDAIDKYKNNSERKFNKVEIDVMKTGYQYDALTLTSNYRYVNFLMSKHIYIDSKIIPSLNLAYKMEISLKKLLNADMK